MNARRPRDIGTAAETAVVRVARLYGFPHADRVALHGARDVGDINLCPGVIVEVKGGDAARNATDGMIDDWLDQTEVERRNAGAEFGLLVVQRRGVGAGNAVRWWTFWRLSWIERLTSGLVDFDGDAHYSLHTPVRTRLGPALDLLRVYGFGEPFMCGACGVEPVAAGMMLCGACLVRERWS